MNRRENITQIIYNANIMYIHVYTSGLEMYYQILIGLKFGAIKHFFS